MGFKMRLFNRSVCAITALSAFWAVPSFAQDRDSHFNGPYVQVFGGYSVQNNDGGDTLVFDTSGNGNYNDQVTTAGGDDAFSDGFCNGIARGATPADTCRPDKDGAEYGARIGYDRRIGNFVLGGLIEASKSEAKDGVTGFSTTPASYSIQREMDYAVSARLRAGFTPGGGALFYVTGGGSYAKIDHKFLTTNMANDFDERRDSKGVWGWQAGGGAEIMLAKNLSLGMEYLYSRYDDGKYNVLVTQGDAADDNPFLLDSGSTRIRGSDKNFDFHSLRATIGVRF